MKKKIFLSLLALSLLSGCGQSVETNTYRCFLGKMMVSSFSIAKDNIVQKKVQSEDIDGTYYANMYFLSSQKDVNDFYSNEDYSISSSEKETNRKLKETLMLVYFIMDIPKGHKAYKRDNVQGELVDQGLTLLTDNFYYYASKPNTFYCMLDLKEDSSITEDGIYSFYYLTSRKYQDLLSLDSIRIIYNVESD